jgi:hypothetical protein
MQQALEVDVETAHLEVKIVLPIARGHCLLLRQSHGSERQD